MVFSPRSSHYPSTVYLDPLAPHLKEYMSNQGFKMNSDVKCVHQISWWSRASLIWGSWWRWNHFISKWYFGTVIHAFITSWLYYCNCCISAFASRVLAGVRKRDNDLILASPHWMPVHFKILLFVLNLWIILHLWAFLSLQLSSGPQVYRGLRGSGKWAFSICASKLWNALPQSIHKAFPLSSFKMLLKTHFYRQAFDCK